MSVNHKRIITLLSAAFFLACSSSKKSGLSDKERLSWYLSVEQTPCFGKCPIYQMSIDGNQQVRLSAKRFLPRIGEYHAAMPDSLFNELVSLTQQATWDTYDSSYMTGYSDLPSTVVRFSNKQRDMITLTYENKLAPEPVVSIVELLQQFRTLAEWENEEGQK
jgi:hypothetical protein